MNLGSRISLQIAMLAILLGMQPVHAQLIINQTQAPTTLVQNYLMGSGVFASNVTFNGNAGSVVAPTFTTLGQIGRYNGSNTNIGFNGGVFLCTNNAVTHLPGPNDQLMRLGGGLGGAGFWTSPDIDLSQLTRWPNWQVSGGSNIGNKSVLEFDFIPTSDMMSVRYVFSSEEYERWACSEYNDAFGFFLSGPGINGPYSNGAINLAYVPGTLDPVCINSVNSGQELVNANGWWANPDPWENCRDLYPSWLNNTQYYRYNGGQWPFAQPPGGVPQLEAPYSTDPYYIQHNGMTVVLTASAAVECGVTYHMKLALGNVGDNDYPSAVWLESGSFTSSDRFSLAVDAGPTVDFNDPDTIFFENDCDSVYLRFNRWGGFYLDEYLQVQVEGSATNGVDVLPAIPDSVHFNQLDSSAVVAIAVPVDLDGPEELVVKLITCNGTKIKIYRFIIDQKPPLVVVLEDQDLDCPADVTLTPVVTGGGEEPGEYTYLWNTGETTPSITHFVDETTQFWVTVKDCWTSEVTDSAWVTLPQYVTMELTLSPDTAIPCLATADIQVGVQYGSGGYTYEWTLNGQVMGTDPILSAPAAVPPVHYVITVTDLCEVQATDSVLVSQAPPVPLVLTLSPDTAVACLGNADLTASVSGGGGVIQYTWTLGGTLVGTDSILNVPAATYAVYTLQASDQCGQTVQGQVMVTTGPTPPLSVLAQGDTVMCAGMPMVLNVITVSGGGGNYSYSWTPSGTGNNGGAAYNVSVQNDTPFTVTVTDECGNQADTTVMAVVLDFPPLTIDVSNDTIVCPGETVPLWVLMSGGTGNYQVDWSSLGSGSDVSWIAGSDGRTFTVYVVDDCGTSASSSVVVDTYPAGVSIAALELGQGTWTFRGTTTPSFGNLVEWDMGDGTTVNDVLDVTHTYVDYDAHWVVLRITTPDGCLAMDSIRTTPPAATLYFPNTFTPDGNGINDTFGGEGVLVEQYELLIFDRWGGLVFESNSMDHRWDGTVDGEEPVTGIYAYRYRAKGLLMPLHQGFGHVNLLR